MCGRLPCNAFNYLYHISVYHSSSTSTAMEHNFIPLLLLVLIASLLDIFYKIVFTILVFVTIYAIAKRFNF